MQRYFWLFCTFGLILPAPGLLLAEQPTTDPPIAASAEQVASTAQKSVVVITVAGRDGKQHGLGTGFVVSADGLIATNLHVIGEARPISVQFADGRKFDVAAVHASDRALDLAIVRIDASELALLKLGDSDRLKLGQPVVALGNPHGLKHSVVSGVVSGTRELDMRKMIQLAIPVEPGNSGGPILDMQGRVQGIMTMKSQVTENLGFAVTINDLKPLLAKPNPIPMSRWLTIGALDRKKWTPLLGARWRQRAGRLLVGGPGQGFGGRSLCLSQTVPPKLPFELAVTVRLDDESGAAGLVFHADGQHKHYGFYPSSGRLRLSRFEGPNVFTWKVLHEVHSEHYRPGQWNHLKVRIEQGKIVCFVNDQQVIESSDDALTTGKVGLAKFRQTQAQFKHFRVAKKIPPSQLAGELVQRINQQIDQLPSLEKLTPGQLAGLVEQSPASLAVIRRRAGKLHERAEQLRRLAEDVHTATVTNELSQLMHAEPDRIDLARAALLAARLDDDELDVDSYLKQIDRMAADIVQSLPQDADEPARLAGLNKYLFAENGFHGSRTDYYHRANSYLNRVIDDREGLPITLSLLYMELGRRLEMKIVGIGLPGHFIVRHEPETGEPQLIDVFDGGKPISREDASEKVMALAGSPLKDEHLVPTTKQQIVLRIFRNLLGIAQRNDDKQAMLRYLEAMVPIDPENIQQRGMRAVLRHQLGRREASIADLDWILQHKPKGIDLEKIRQMRELFQRRGP